MTIAVMFSSLTSTGACIPNDDAGWNPSRGS
jgi:hypothetical protein